VKPAWALLLHLTSLPFCHASRETLFLEIAHTRLPSATSTTWLRTPYSAGGRAGAARGCALPPHMLETSATAMRQKAGTLRAAAAAAPAFPTVPAWRQRDENSCCSRWLRFAAKRTASQSAAGFMPRLTEAFERQAAQRVPFSRIFNILPSLPSDTQRQQR